MHAKVLELFAARDIAFAYDPRILGYLKRSIRDLWKDYRAGLAIAAQPAPRERTVTSGSASRARPGIGASLRAAHPMLLEPLLENVLNRLLRAVEAVPVARLEPGERALHGVLLGGGDELPVLRAEAEHVA